MPLEALDHRFSCISINLQGQVNIQKDSRDSFKPVDMLDTTMFQMLSKLVVLSMQEGVDFCNELFKIERGLKDLSPEDRYNKRLEQSKLVLEVLFVVKYKEGTGIT